MQNNVDDAHQQSDSSIQDSILPNDSNPSEPSLEDSKDTTILPAEFTESITAIEFQLQQGNVQKARALYNHMDSDIKQKHADVHRLKSVKRYLEFDPSEFWVPCILFIFWFFIAFRSV